MTENMSTLLLPPHVMENGFVRMSPALVEELEDCRRHIFNRWCEIEEKRREIQRKLDARQARNAFHHLDITINIRSVGDHSEDSI